MTPTRLALRALFAAIAVPWLAVSAGCFLLGASGPVPPDLSHLTPLEAARIHADREAAVRTLQAEVKARIESPKRSGSVRAVVLVKRPDAFRMRAYPPLGGTIFDLAIRDEEIHFYVPDEDTLYVQKAGRHAEKPKKREGEGQGPDLDALFSTTGLARMILGTGTEEEVTFRFVERTAEGLKLAVVNADGLVEGYAWIDPTYLLKTRQIVFGRGGKKELDLRFEDYDLHESTGLWWPRRMSIHAPRKKFRLELRFATGDLSLNENLENDLFDLDVPEDVKRVER
jgi:outer membrane lipoprotein-sorting protein